MKKVLFLLIAALVCLAPVMVQAEGTTKTLTFEWTMNDTTNLKEWVLKWSETAGGPYDVEPAAVIAYDPSAPGPVYSSPEVINVTGDTATHVIKYFVLVACGDVPQADGSKKYMCSGNSNEVSWDFWIPAGQFSVPVQFNIKATP